MRKNNKKEQLVETLFDRECMNDEEKILFGHEVEGVVELDYTLTI
jgi:hypothetical protein